MTDEKEKILKTKKEEKKEKQTPKKKDTKYTLLQLVRKSEEDEAVIVGALANKHLLTDYYIEQEKQSKGFDVTPTLTEKEFEKLIISFKNKEV